MQSHPLAATVRELMQPTEWLDVADSLDRAGTLLRRANSPFVPVLREGLVEGVATEPALAAALGGGASTSDSVASALGPNPATISPHSTGGDALRMFVSTGAAAFLVVDEVGRVLGVLRPTDLLQRRGMLSTPASVGGMATPFGVHLTTGATSAGVSPFALFSTGMLLCTILIVAALLTDSMVWWIARQGASLAVQSSVASALPIVLFLGGMRWLPLSGIHAAEHKVVHAIERGEDLVPEIVRRMPRVHPRCGTNIAVGLALFLGVATSHWIADETLRIFAAMVVTLSLWKRLGSVVQAVATTKTPTDRQLESGIRSGRHLLDKWRTSRSSVVTPWQRIWHSGMVLVMAGSVTMTLLVWAIAAALGYPDVLL